MKRILALILILLVSGCVSEDKTYHVSKIIDGDTFDLSNGERIRMLGINTPEKHEYYFEEATDRLRELIANKEVRLEKGETDKDWYGRSLRYVYIGNEFINAEMVEGGYARLYLLNEKKYDNILTYAENYAKNNQLGIWNNNH